jgi:two-component system cell cycle sensor histidine kinase/response regulator CckA
LSFILLVSILIRMVALGWSIRLLTYLRDWRMGFLSAMLALMALRQSLTLIDTATSLKVSFSSQVTELPGLAVSVLAFLSVLFLERIITERRKIKRALQTSEDRLRQSQKMEAVGRLAGGVAHDFNNLLTAILGYSEILLSQLRPDSEEHEAAAEIQNAGRRAAELTGQLLAFGRKQQLRPEVVDLNGIVSGLESMLGRLIGEQIDFQVRLDSDIGAVSADVTQLEQVIVNLVVNARDALRMGGVLQVSTGETTLTETDRIDFPEGHAGRFVRLSVSDTGEGMDVATQEQIFEPFFTRKSEEGGTGLGLATVFGIVRQSGGTIRVQSAPGSGSTFDVLLPRVDPAPAVVSDAPTPPPPVEERNRSWTILLVADDAAVLKLARTALESAGHTMLAAISGEEGEKIARDHPGRIDLLLTDVVMRGMTGIELAERIASERPEMVVVYMSGYAKRTASEVQSLPRGAHFLAKPFTANRLLEIIQRVTRQQSPTTHLGVRSE